MNISFTPRELLHTFETLVKTQMDFPEDNVLLLNKFRTAILSALSKLHEENVATSFQAWEETQTKKIQAKKIQDLQQKNENLSKDLPKPNK